MSAPPPPVPGAPWAGLTRLVARDGEGGGDGDWLGQGGEPVPDGRGGGVAGPGAPAPPGGGASAGGRCRGTGGSRRARTGKSGPRVTARRLSLCSSTVRRPAGPTSSA